MRDDFDSIGETISFIDQLVEAVEGPQTARIDELCKDCSAQITCKRCCIRRLLKLRSKGFDVDGVYPLAYDVGPHVKVDGQFYAAFSSYYHAKEAADNFRMFWPAAQGRRIEAFK